MSIENQYIEEITGGSQEALKELYLLYSSKVYNTILSYTKNEEDAEELLQDVFVTIFDTASAFRFTSKVSTWVYRIAVNKSLDFLRRKNSAKRLGVFTSLYKKGTSEMIIEPVDFAHPGIKLENSENAQLLFRVIDELSENQKTAFILTQVEGLSQKEVADIMNTTAKSVESLLQRAKENLRKSLEKIYPERGISSKIASK